MYPYPNTSCDTNTLNLVMDQHTANEANFQISFPFIKRTLAFHLNMIHTYIHIICLRSNGTTQVLSKSFKKVVYISMAYRQWISKRRSPHCCNIRDICLVDKSPFSLFCPILQCSPTLLSTRKTVPLTRLDDITLPQESTHRICIKAPRIWFHLKTTILGFEIWILLSSTLGRGLVVSNLANICTREFTL